MATPTWTNQVKHIANGEQVNAGVTSRPDRALEGRTTYLKARLDALESGQAVFARDATLHEDLLEGQPVFFNADTQQFESALAAVENDDEQGVLVPTESSDCLGIVASKENATKGDVLLFGYFAIDISNATGASPTAGRYYLSSSEAGKLVKQRPAATVSVLYYDGNGHVFVQPSMKDFIEDHVHFKFDLVCEPAGHSSQPDPDAIHVITVADVTAAGWLPASHESFKGRAPARAAFGYNLAAHPELDRVWPPIPVTAVLLTLDKGSDHVGGTEIPLGADGLVVVDRYGIWWMSNCYGDVPWPTATNTSLSSFPSEVSLPASLGPECPRFEKMRLILSFIRMTFSTSKTVVTSLKPAEGSPVRFVNCDGDEASTGDLFALLETAFLIDDNDFDGNLAIKDISGSKLKRGYMVQGVNSGNANLTVTGTRPKIFGEGASAQVFFQGLLTFTVNLEPGDRELPAQLVRVDDVKERFYQDVMFLGFPADQESSIRVKVKIPPAGLPATPRLKLRTQLLGRATGTLPAMDLSYRIVSRPSGSEVALPLVDTAIGFDPSQSITVDKYVEVESDEITVAAGDTVLFTLSRVDDGYSGEIGLLDIAGILFSGS